MTHKFFATAGTLLVASLAFAQEPTRIEKWLQPTDPDASRLVVPGGAPRVAKPAIEQPELALAPLDVTLPSLPLADRKATRPRSLTEAPPITAWFGDAAAPHALQLPSPTVVVQAGTTPQDLQALPVLGQFVRDQASLADPSFEISMSLILAPKSPERLNPVPFEAWSLPDPYQNAAIVRLRSAWAESDKLPLLQSPPK